MDVRETVTRPGVDLEKHPDVTYADDAQAETLLDKHMARWSVLLDRLK